MQTQLPPDFSREQTLKMVKFYKLQVQKLFSLEKLDLSDPITMLEETLKVEDEILSVFGGRRN